MRFSAPAGLSRFIAEKGSVCIDGISLTVNAIMEKRIRGQYRAPYTAK